MVASDLNEGYLSCWPLVRRAWLEIASLEPVLVLIARAVDVPGSLAQDPLVHVFEPVERVHTALQAQCIRLVYPALVHTDGGVLTSDVDMAPLSGGYFHRHAGRIDAKHFLAYRDVLLWGGEIPVCYNAALPGTWGEIFRVRTIDDVRERLAGWGAGLYYDGVRGGRGWDADQVILYQALIERGRRQRDVWILDDRFSGFRRLDGKVVERCGGPDGAQRRGLARRRYTDFHCLLPFDDHRSVNEEIVDLARGSLFTPVGPRRGSALLR